MQYNFPFFKFKIRRKRCYHYFNGMDYRRIRQCHNFFMRASNFNFIDKRLCSSYKSQALFATDQSCPTSSTSKINQHEILCYFDTAWFSRGSCFRRPYKFKHKQIVCCQTIISIANYNLIFLNTIFSLICLLIYLRNYLDICIWTYVRFSFL